MDEVREGISQKDAQKRKMILEDNLWQVILYIGTPLALFQGLNQIFKILDSMMAAHISPLTVSAVAYLSQLALMISSIGGGLAMGSSIKISEAYGAGDYELVRKRVSSLFIICGCIGMGLLVMIPFTSSFLHIVGTPDDFISEGTLYLSVTLVDITLLLFNTAYIAIERARGNAVRILWLNLGSIIVKLALTAWFVYGLNMGIVMIAVATVISDLVIFFACIYHIFYRGKGEVFGFSLKSVAFNKKVTTPMLSISLPVIVEKTTFQLGKVAVNGMSTIYGSLIVGALGISNNIGGMTTNPQNGLQEAGAAIISQNLGAGNSKRTIEAFYKLAIINMVVGIIGYVITLVFLQPIAGLFASKDIEFANLIALTYKYEATGLIPLGLFSAVMSLLYGYGYTKLTLLINFSRIFILRIPVLWVLQRFTDYGQESIGIVMMVSNIGTGILALGVSIIVVRQIKKKMNKESVYVESRSQST